ncbi:MAG TPA: tRNA pseudouridine(38-40) synthase TruA, partial [Acidimicrobiales bacterium]
SGPGPVDVVVPPPPAGHQRIRMVMAYDGSRFRGMAENDGVPTVVGVVRDVLERALGHGVELAMAGRTDAGVHAWGQVVSFDAVADKADPERLARAVNGQCAPAVVVREATFAAADFDARFSARSRRYRYTVLNRVVPDPFLAATTWWVPQELQLNALRLGCDALLGSHDFSSFCRRPRREGDVSLVRRVLDARWVDLDDGVLRFDIEATAFCHQMVRSITGTLVDMGRGRRRAGEMAGILRARDRSAAGTIAPPHGLCLWDVVY